MQWIQSLDSKALIFVIEHCRCAFFDVLMPVITSFGDKGFIWIAAAAVFILIGNPDFPWRKWGVLLFAGLGMNALFCNVILKPLFARIRPYNLFDYTVLIEHVGDYSFPSGHTSTAFAAAVILYAMNKKAGVAAYIFAVIMAFSRVYVGVHFPTDVLCGALVGIVVARGVLRVCKAPIFGESAPFS